MLHPSTSPLSVTHIFSLVDALRNLYLFEPTLEPEATIPPGNGVIAPGTALIASTAESAANNPAGWFSASMNRFPPATPAFTPSSDSTRKSPDMSGIEWIFLPWMSRTFSYPSP